MGKLPRISKSTGHSNQAHFCSLNLAAHISSKLSLLNIVLRLLKRYV